MNKKIEILSPVGSFEALRGAVNNGADAVYLGGKVFNARQYASNFENEELKEAVIFAHLHKVKVYVTINILLSDSELKEIIDYLTFLFNIDVDAVIVQDIGLVRIIKQLFPDFEIHASTQMTINNYMGVNLLQELGFSRVVLARELSVEEIQYISENTNIELEGFVHGALCVSYSGQCLMSSLIGGRSGNRGRCAQPCRMPYSLVNIDNNKVINKDFEEKYLLSPKDLNTIDYLERIVESGITSLKIEGRMKRPEYVATITRNYKLALEKILGEKSEGITPKDKEEILQIFNRGFTKGHILNDDFSNFISYDKPNNKGTYLGRVVSIDKKYINILLNKDISKGDGIEIVSQTHENVGLVPNNIYLNGKAVETVDKGKIVQIDKLPRIYIDSKVFKTSDIKLLHKAKKTYDDDNKISINMNLEIAIGQKIKLNIWDDNFNNVYVESDFIPEKAIKVSLTKESVLDQMNKLGNTQFILENMELNLTEDTMVPKSVLNMLRREGIEELSKKITDFNKRKFVQKEEIIKKSKNIFNYGYSKNKKRSTKKIGIKINNINQFKNLDLNKLDRIYLDFRKDLRDVVSELKNKNKEIYLSTNKIIHNKEFNKLQSIIEDVGVSNINGISVSNLGTLKFVKDRYDTDIHCDIGMNIFNSSSVKLLQDVNVSSFTFSPELKLSQIKQMNKNIELPSEVIGYGHIPNMVTKYCPLSIVKDCNGLGCKNCDMKKGYGLLDRKNIMFPMERKDNATIIYNSYPIMILDSINDVYSSGIDMIRLDFTLEKEVSDIQNIYYDYCNEKISLEDARDFINEFKKKTEITKGHFYRGVL